MADRNPVSITLQAVLLCLTTTTGIIDAVCYLGMGHVLVANMTGNIVFLGLALAGAKGFTISSFLVALGSFLVGATIGGRLGKVLDAHRRRWLTTASVIQAGLAAAAALAVVAGVLGPTGTARLWVIALLGAGTGVQNATIRRLAIPDLTTSVLTMTITGLGADSTLGGGNHPRRSRRLESIAAMLIGALVGGALMVHVGFTPTLGVLAGVLALVAIGFAIVPEVDPPREPAPTRPEHTAPLPPVQPAT
ncbi:MAG TPA: YoaK family protein [Acidimicrobiales bacterium]|jgi:uncharacterized membrane protein YoaK (UPF0700 family)|nr:YoaK family protein [Acidimicrobiales bacterium]